MRKIKNLTTLGILFGAWTVIAMVLACVMYLGTGNLGLLLLRVLPFCLVAGVYILENVMVKKEPEIKHDVEVGDHVVVKACKDCPIEDLVWQDCFGCSHEVEWTEKSEEEIKEIFLSLFFWIIKNRPSWLREAVDRRKEQIKKWFGEISR